MVGDSFLGINSPSRAGNLKSFTEEKVPTAFEKSDANTSRVGRLVLEHVYVFCGENFTSVQHNFRNLFFVLRSNKRASGNPSYL